MSDWGRRFVTDEDREKVAAMSADGFPVWLIAERMDLHESTVSKIRMSLGIARTCRMMTIKQVQRMRELRAEGMLMREIADAVGTSKGVVQYHLARSA